MNNLLYQVFLRSVCNLTILNNALKKNIDNIAK
jgi:hypothetical protein